MNSFGKILSRIKQRRSLNSILNDLQDLDEVLLDKRLEIFKELVTPRFSNIVLNNWNGKYIWSSDFNEEGIKHVVEYNVSKFYGGHFYFGNCYDFIPTPSGKRLKNHKTVKSAQILHYNHLGFWDTNLAETRDQLLHKNKVSTINEKKFRNSITNVLDSNLSELEHWFFKNSNVRSNIDRHLLNIKAKSSDDQLRSIKSEYVLAFLFKKVNETNLSERYIFQFFDKCSLSSEVKDLVLKRLELD